MHPSHRRDSAGCTTGFGQWDGRSLTGKQLNLKQLMYQAERCRKMQKVQYKTRNLRSFKPSRNSCKDTTTLKILKGFSVQYYFWVLMLLANCCDPKRSIDFGRSQWPPVAASGQWPCHSERRAMAFLVFCGFLYLAAVNCESSCWQDPSNGRLDCDGRSGCEVTGMACHSECDPCLLNTRLTHSTHFLLLHLSWNIFGPGLHMYLLDMWLHMVARGCTWLHVPEECRHLDTVEQRRFSTNEFRYPSSPALVITASRDGKRCASTWAFNAVR